jgi:hypothetical protein
MANDLSEWLKSFRDTRVQPGTTSGDFVNSETVVLVSGPAKISEIQSGYSTTLVPIGLAQHFTVTQGKQIYEFPEIGSSNPFAIPGRVRTTSNISRVLFDGPSLMYALNLSMDNNELKIENVPTNIGEAATKPQSDYPAGGWKNPLKGKDYVKVGDITDKFFINLRSSFFNKPIGLGAVLFDNEDNFVGGFYLEESYINGHNLTIASNAVVIMENASIISSSLYPLSKDDVGS